LTGVEENLYITKTTLRALDEDNQVMMEENLNLRQASLDGIAIAEAFETLSKERERLSVDLAERTATIKKLLEHNNELAMRLKQFSAEDKFFTPDRDGSKKQSFI
jgi:regulator of replication initiation timing